MSAVARQTVPRGTRVYLRRLRVRALNQAPLGALAAPASLLAAVASELPVSVAVPAAAPVSAAAPVPVAAVDPELEESELPPAVPEPSPVDPVAVDPEPGFELEEVPSDEPLLPEVAVFDVSAVECPLEPSPLLGPMPAPPDELPPPLELGALDPPPPPTPAPPDPLPASDPVDPLAGLLVLVVEPLPPDEDGVPADELLEPDASAPDEAPWPEPDGVGPLPPPAPRVPPLGPPWRPLVEPAELPAPPSWPE